MLTHHGHDDDSIDIRWRRPVTRDRGPVRHRVESPISRRLLEDLQLARCERLLTIGVRDPQFLEIAASAVGTRGHIAAIEPDPEQRNRLRHITARLRDGIVVRAELPRRGCDRYDAIAVVTRDRIVPDLDLLHGLAGRLDADGRLAVVAFASPMSCIASSGVVHARPHPRTPLRRAS